VSVVEIGDDLRPYGRTAQRRDAILRGLLEHQCQKPAEYVTADGFVELVERASSSRIVDEMSVAPCPQFRPWAI
jgi:hypothetical protein